MSSSRVVVLVRTCCPGASALARIKQWAQECSLHDPPIAFHVSIDVTHAQAHLEGLMASFAETSSLCSIHTYTEEEMLQQFPKLRSAKAAMVGEPDWSGLRNLAETQDLDQFRAEASGRWEVWAGRKYRPVSIAWGFHTEAICMWWQIKNCKQEPRCVANKAFSLGPTRALAVYHMCKNRFRNHIPDNHNFNN